MNFHVGTSGYSYKEWKGNFYPEKLASSKMLGYYAERLSSVELNNTFYRMPKTEGSRRGPRRCQTASVSRSRHRGESRTSRD